MSRPRDVAETFFPSGTKMLFHQTAAPTGWTKLSVTGSGDDAINDVGLRVVTGTITDGIGGSVAFDTAFASKTPTITMTNAEKILDATMIPSHVHTSGWTAWQTFWAGYQNRRLVGGGQNTGYGSPDTAATGGGLGHTHTNTAASSAINLDVKYVDMIIASKD